MTRFVCLGDSFTEGMVDDLRPDGRHLGWADRVAEGLARAALQEGPVEYANLAIRGKLLDQVVREQIPVALALGPDFVTFQAGLNDVLRPGVDLPALFRRYEDAVARLAEGGTRVVLFTGRGRQGWNSRMSQRLGPRFAAFNDNVHSVAQMHGCLLVDLESLLMISDDRCWGVDRLHLNAVGHERVAAEVLHTLGITEPEILGGSPGWWHEPLPPSVPQRWVASAVQDVHWFGVHLLPWMVRRLRGVSSGDGMSPKDPMLRMVGADA